jgi:hypothetical protein
MTTYANITPPTHAEGITYCSAQGLTPTEADLANQPNANYLAPIPVLYGEAIVAVVQLSVNGIAVGNSSYVVMQTDMGDGVWVDVAWCVYFSSQAPQTFVLCGGGSGTINNAFQQSRNPGQVPQPQANGSNQMPLGGRVRFVGQSKLTSGSSSAPGQPTVVSATIKYRILALR